jgi:hypothetical protein
MTVFWDTAPCSLVEMNTCFKGAYDLHFHCDARIQSTISLKNVIFILCRENLKSHLLTD